MKDASLILKYNYKLVLWAVIMFKTPVFCFLGQSNYSMDVSAY